MDNYKTCDSATIEWLDNGFVLNVSGTTDKGEYKQTKVMGDKHFVLVALESLMELPRER